MTDTRSESSNGAIAPLLDGPLPIFENLIQLFLSEIIAENACAGWLAAHDLPHDGGEIPQKKWWCNQQKFWINEYEMSITGY